MKAFTKLVFSTPVRCRISSASAFNKRTFSTRIRPCLYDNARPLPHQSWPRSPIAHYSSSSGLWKPKTQDEKPTSLTDPILSSPDAPLIPGNGKITCVYFDRKGTLVVKGRELTKNQIAEQFDLRHRDLRDIDLKSEAVTRILIRPATILLQFFHLVMVIQANEALLIDLQRPKCDRGADFYRDFEQRLSGVKEAADVPELSYELRAVEAALVAVLSALREDLVAAKLEAEENVQNLKLESGFTAIGLDQLFEHSRRLGKIEQKARLVRGTIREILDADEDLAGMYLTDRLAGRPHAISDHQEAEYMLEAYHKAADGLAESAHSSISLIRKKEAIFRSSLAVQRNQIMFLEAKIAIHTLGLAAGTLVAGLFGMNLVNYFEESPYGFLVVTGICVVFSACFSLIGMRSIRKIQTLKVIQDQAFSMGKKL